MRRLLQDEMIKAAKAPKTPGARIEHRDIVVPGLMLRVTTKGVKSFCLVYKLKGEHPDLSKTGKAKKGKQHRITLGEYPFMTLKAARKEARLLLEVIGEGRDPSPNRDAQVQERHANSLAEVARRFVAQECAGLASGKRVERTLEMHVLPTLGHLPIRDIGRRAVHDLLDGIVENTGKGAAAGVLKRLRSLFSYAVDRELIDSNPALKMKRGDLKQNGEAGRALNDEELRSIWRATGTLGYPIGPWLRLLMLTGQRRDEWRKASRPEIDIEERALVIPSHRYKTRRDHSVPLVGEAWEIVEALPEWQDGDFLFSTAHGRSAVDPGGAKRKVDRLTGPLAPWTFHDFRKTCKTRMAALGVAPEHSEAVAGRVKKGMEGVYNRYDYAVEKREALLKYQRHLMGVVK